jgi:hypothetical protein
MLKSLLVVFMLAVACEAMAAESLITVVVGENAPALEKFAAGELAAQFQKLFEVGAKIQTSLPADSSPAVLVGSPQTNAAIAALGDDFWPKLSEQGHLLKSTKTGDRAMLVVGGGSPVATLWAVYELGYRFGIRPLLHGDVLPVEKPAFHLDGFDVSREPAFRTRAWSAFNGLAMGAESWSIEDHARLLAQLAKLQFTHVVLPVNVRQFDPLRVDGDSGGRIAFKGGKVFEAPAFAGITDPTARAKADDELVSGLKARAAMLGITVATTAPPNTRPLPLGAPTNSVLPQFSLRALATDLEAIRDAKADGFVATIVMPGDLNAAVHFVSRASFDDKLTGERALDDLVTPICGEGVAERLQKGFDLVEQAAKLIFANDPAVGVPDPQVLLRHDGSGEAPPAWWTQAKDLYVQAMNEMYRANTRARGGARPFILYHAKRMEFAMNYFTALEAVRRAGNARSQNNAAARAEALEAAVEGIYNALNAFADVARDQSDRGVIALLNAYGYHPLLKKLDETGK